MSEDTLLRALRECIQTIDSLGIPAERADKMLLGPSLDEALRHARWMAETAIELVKEHHTEKAFRWLGFVQGVLWANHYLTIADARKMNRDSQKPAA
jgi:hypothetical protein